MKILGIDPGTRNLGYSILRVREDGKILLIEAGLLKFKTTILKKQMIELDRGIDLIFDKYDIDEVAIEDIFFAHNPKSIIKLAQFRGALSLKILLKVGDYAEYTPLQVKKSITGNGKSTKEQVSFMVRKMLNIKQDIKPFDITDAIAVAITHLQRLRLKRDI